MSIDNYATPSESGIAHYFEEFGHRLARETTHQAWLLISVSKFINPQLVVAELNVPLEDAQRSHKRFLAPLFDLFCPHDSAIQCCTVLHPAPDIVSRWPFPIGFGVLSQYLAE